MKRWVGSVSWTISDSSRETSMRTAPPSRSLRAEPSAAATSSATIAPLWSAAAWAVRPVRRRVARSAWVRSDRFGDERLVRRSSRGPVRSGKFPRPLPLAPRWG